MKIIKLTEENFERAIGESLQALQNDGVVVVPTETQYGLSVLASNDKAVKKVRYIKGRDFDNPLPLVADSLESVSNFFSLNTKELKVAEKFWPGPVGLLLAPKLGEPAETIARLTLGAKYESVGNKQNKLVVRVTSDKFSSELSRQLGLPIVSTSANISGQPACYDIACVQEQFKDNEVLPDLVIDAGPLPPKPPSTMLDLTGNKPVIIREGANFAEVKAFLKTLKV